jgi:hypothetical protein
VQPLSQHSFYKKNKKEFDELVKKTKKVGNASGDSVLFSKSYIIDYTKENIHYYLVGCLVQLNNHLFMNFTPIESSDIKDNENEKTSYDPGNSFGGYTIAKVLIINSNTIQLDFIDGGYIYDQVKSGHMKIKNERNELYDTFLITASTGELNQFLKKYGNDPRLYNKENKVTLIRKT